MTATTPRDRVLRVGLLAALAALLAHALFYRFLCDDAFISFRYAHNLASGHGLVFNPGFERVEGYTNFLWVLALAAGDALGARPESSAPVLSLLLTGALWALLARASLRWIPERPWRVAVLLPAVWLALTRSVAVWSTSGLETRLFEVLTVAGVLRVLEDVAAADRGQPRAPWIAALCLALATLTRPDGLLIGGATLGTAAAWLLVSRRLRPRDVAVAAAVFVGIVGSHLLFRHAYYGEWVPNTYFAKVNGRSWWAMGVAYEACFVLEYAAWLWVPLIAAGILRFVKDRRAYVPLILAAAVIPHALYVASIGGDHFEFRPLDAYFPLLFLLMGRGAAALAEGILSRWSVAVYAGVVAAGLVAIPWSSHHEFPAGYQVGFPGLGATRGDRVSYLDPSRDPIYRWPGLRSLAEAHRALLRKTTSRLVGIRQEEHARFLATVIPEGRRLKTLVEHGVLPPDTYVAMSAVGAIPYYSNLRILDRLGLTDPVVAKSEPGEFRVMAHDRHATFEYATERGVDLWTEHPVHLLAYVTDPDLVWTFETARASGTPVFFAETEPGEIIVGRLPRGIDATAARLPKLSFHAVSDDTAFAMLLDRVIEARRQALAGHPDDREASSALGSVLAAAGRDEEALAIFRALAEKNDAEGWYNIGAILLRRGALEEATDAFRKSVAADPTIAAARHNLGLALVKQNQLPEAIPQFREAVRLEPDSEEAIYTLGVALLLSGDRAGATDCVQRLESLETPEGMAFAQRLRKSSEFRAPGP